MTQDQIEHMAREAAGDIDSLDSDGDWILSASELARFAALVEAAERDRCAALCDGVAEACEHSSDGLKRVGAINAAKSCARLIRA